MKRWMLWASVLAPSAATACKKNNDPESTLPPATQDGRNTAGWLADGQPHVASPLNADLLVSPSPALSGGFNADSTFGLSMKGYKDPLRPRVSFSFKAYQPGTYYLDGRTLTRPGNPNKASYEHENPATSRYYTNTRYTGRVVLTRADVRSGAAAGTFEFRAIDSQDSTKSITITNGRFDYGGR